MLAEGNHHAPAAAPEETIFDVLVARRRELKLRQLDVARHMHVSQSTVCQMERTRNPCMSTLIRYADAVGAVMSVEAIPPVGKTEP